MPISAPLELHREVVRPEWIDCDGHVNVAYYVLAFDHACDAFLDFVGLDQEYRGRTGGTTFAAECHVTYQREVGQGQPLRFSSRLLGFDEKRIHHVHRMYPGDEDTVLASMEWMSLHVDLPTRRVAPMGAEILARLARVHASHRTLPPPPEAGRVIGLPAARPA